MTKQKSVIVIQKTELNSDDFVKMILLDAIFIIELFWRTLNYRNDYILRKPWLEIGIQDDLILLENQLRIFVLEKLYKFPFNDSSSCNHHEEGKEIVEHKNDLKTHDAPFVKLSRKYFSDYYKLGIGEEVPIGEEVNYFTDLLRYLLCSLPDLSTHAPSDTRYCAKKLDDAGLKFKAAEKRPLLEIQFHQNFCRCFDCSCLLACLPCFKCFPFVESMQCILEVPPLEIDDYLRNAYICNYVVLLDCPIDTEEDVNLLVKKKVIVNLLGSNIEMADLINKLGEQIVESTSCYHDIAKNLNEHYDYPCNHILASLTRVLYSPIFGKEPQLWLD